MRLKPDTPLVRTASLHWPSQATAPDRNAIRSAVDALYDAAGDASALPRAVEAIANCLRAHRAILIVRPGNTFAATPLFAQPYRIDDEVLAAVSEKHYWEADLWSRSADKMGLSASQVVCGEELVDDVDLVRSPLYVDVLQPLEMPRLLAGIADMTSEDIVHLSVFRSNRRGAFNGEEHRAMRALLPAIRVAARSVLQFQRQLLRTGALENTLDDLQRAVFLLDKDGRILNANATAARLLATQDELVACRGYLQVRSSPDNAALMELLDAVRMPGRVLRPTTVHDRHGNATLVLTARPLRTAAQARRDTDLPGTAVAAVFAMSAKRRAPAPAELLSNIYALTPAEARLTERLAKGLSLIEVANGLGITRDTARSHLKAVYRKTGTNRQSDLVALAISLGLGTADR